MTEHDARTLRHLLLTFPALEIRRDALGIALSQNPRSQPICRERTLNRPTPTNRSSLRRADEMASC